MDEPLTVLYQDAHVLAVAKPAGLATQANRPGGECLETAVRDYLQPADPAAAYLGTVHRLDRPVSGVIVWALTPRAARRLARQFERRTVQKEYWAVVEPLATPPDPGYEPTWSDHLAPSSDDRGVVAVLAADAPGARLATTRVRRIGDGEGPFQAPDGLVGLRMWPLTGRTHQLRAQAAHRCLPIWGDAPYGSQRPFPAGIALHARSIEFSHPALHRPLRIEAPPPEGWARSGVLWC